MYSTDKDVSLGNFDFYEVYDFDGFPFSLNTKKIGKKLNPAKPDEYAGIK